MDDNRFMNFMRKYVLNKYVLVLLVFGVVFVFVGEQSFIKGIQRRRQIRETERQLRATREDIRGMRHSIDLLRSTDSLERYAREHYYMHADGEDVYIVHED
jgi:cell division protein FtsB